MKKLVEVGKCDLFEYGYYVNGTEYSTETVFRGCITNDVLVGFEGELVEYFRGGTEWAVTKTNSNGNVEEYGGYWCYTSEEIYKSFGGK